MCACSSCLDIQNPYKTICKSCFQTSTIALLHQIQNLLCLQPWNPWKSLGIPRKIVAFVIPTGYSFNLDGTTLYLSLASIFVAQAARINLPIEKQLIICFTLMLTSKGVAGVSRAPWSFCLALRQFWSSP